MPSLPKKSSKGTNFKTWTVDTVDALIEYFNSNWIQAGNGISVRRTASGVVVGLAKTPPVPSVKLTTGGGGSTQDISATVSGGTAFVTLSGSTSAAKFVGTGSVTISGNTNTGNIEINATGGSGTVGFPDLLTGSTVSAGTNYPVTSDSWLIGFVGIYGDTSLNYPTNLSGYVDLKVSSTANPSQSRTFELYCNQGLYSVNYSGLNEWFPVCIPIKAGYTIRLTVSGSATSKLYLHST
jgi:hypothetical protein